jgi:tRNA 2-thiouridine synthesizing protein D
MKFALLVTAAVFSQQGSQTALRFARAAIGSGHSIERVFFFQDGVHNASQIIVVPQDENNPAKEWQQFCEEHKVEASVCVSAALKRGIIDAHQSRRYGTAAHNAAPQMNLAGLGQLVDALIRADRLLTFG